MFSLDHILTSGKVLGKHFTVILVLFTFLRKIVIIHPHHLRLLLIVYLVKLNLLKHRLSIIILALDARNKAKTIWLYD
jgi:hypothetical protein